MKIPYYRAKEKETGKYIEGFYFEYPSTTYCFSEDYKKHPVELIPCIIFHRMSDWGLPNRPMICNSIDKSTLEQIGWIDTDIETYKPMEWITHI